MLAKLLESFDQGDTVALGRLLKEVENQSPLSNAILSHTHEKKGRAQVVGITGPPGAGKSTVIAELCRAWVKQGLTIGIVCIDPTSPFSGGALLGDRIRMQGCTQLPGVFIKSLATRGSHGGLAAAAAGVVQVLDAYGKDIILVETVGVGQVEVDILDLADTVVLVTVPGLGDAIQTFKAGVMEIAHLFVVNQADRPGADESIRDLEMMVDQARQTGWKPLVTKTIATQKEGIIGLANNIESHRNFLETTGLWQESRRGRRVKRMVKLAAGYLREELTQFLDTDERARLLLEEVREGRTDPQAGAIAILQGLLKK
jgi:LAO/AO transport system kinase